MIAGIQTFGELVHFHPHIHALVTEGGFRSDGTFVRLPSLGRDRLLTAWQSKVFDLLRAAGKIDQNAADAMRSWPHSGFCVDDSVRLTAGDRFGLEQLAQYIFRCPFSLARVVRLTEEGSVIYRAEKDGCRRFPGPASADGHHAQHGRGRSPSQREVFCGPIPLEAPQSQRVHLGLSFM